MMKDNLDDKKIDVFVGSQLAKLRLKHNLSQSQIADLLGVSYQQLQKYENGKNRLGAASMLKLKEALGIPVSYFFDGYKPPSIAIETPSTLIPQSELLEMLSHFLRIAQPNLRSSLIEIAKEYSTHRLPDGTNLKVHQ